jgi:hypothetical protein
MRTNDLSFVNKALVCAERITLLDEQLVTYRKGTLNNSQSTNHLSPTDFYKALCELQAFLKDKQYYDIVKKSFINLAAIGCLYNLESLSTGESFEKLYDLLQNKGLKQLEIIGIPQDFFHEEVDYQKLLSMQELTSTEFIFNRYLNSKEELLKIKTATSMPEQQLFDEKSYKIGRFITFGPRKLRKLISMIKERGFRYSVKFCLRKLKLLMLSGRSRR